SHCSSSLSSLLSLFFFTAPPPPLIFTLSLHDALPISSFFRRRSFPLLLINEHFLYNPHPETLVFYFFSLAQLKKRHNQLVHSSHAMFPVGSHHPQSLHQSANQ